MEDAFTEKVSIYTVMRESLLMGKILLSVLVEKSKLAIHMVQAELDWLLTTY
jgi:hypothetical protein